MPAGTDCPVLLNTSFNVKGQPIVNNPRQAIDCYQSTNIDCLILDDILLFEFFYILITII